MKTAYFTPPFCNKLGYIGTNCTVTNDLCSMLQPCRNRGTCANNSRGYNCSCPDGFNGTRCQNDHRSSKLLKSSN